MHLSFPGGAQLCAALESSMNHLHCLPQNTVVWGHDVLACAKETLAAQGFRRAMTFTVEPLRKLADTHLAQAAGDGVGCFTDLPPHVPDTNVRKALATLRDANADSILALGGGSVLDAAKAASYLHQQQTGRFLPIAAFPTTLSGSEFSHYFGITETEGAQKFKRSYAVRDTVPTVVFIDPLLVRGTPRALLLSSAIKGIDHAVEGMRQVGKEHPHAILAASGVERFFSVLEKWPAHLETAAAVEQGLVTMDDLLQLQLAAWQCYFYPASVIYGLSHRIGHILGGTFGLPHSMTSCITLAPVIRECAAMYGDKLQIFTSARPDRGAGAANLLADRIASAVAQLGLPSRLRAFDVRKEQLPEIAQLLRTNYPAEVGDLGADAGARLGSLLEQLW
jgi:alcohol dehydrogenase class IV